MKKAHQIQEIGEFQEFNDDVEYLLDTLQVCVCFTSVNCLIDIFFCFTRNVKLTMNNNDQHLIKFMQVFISVFVLIFLTG